MASKLAFSLIFTFILLILLSQTDAHSSHSHENITSPFDFLKHLQGCHKGDHVNGLHELKKYLETFGYLSYFKNQSHADNDDFDDFLENAIKLYQQNFHLNASGILDSYTVSQMSSPRCGVADIINGTNWMTSGGKRGKKTNHYGRKHGLFHTVSHFSFFNGNPRWPSSKYHLRYGFLPGTPIEVYDPVSRAFEMWATYTHFTFSLLDDYESADIHISFESSDHGDGSPFDGAGGTLAHAYSPTDGRFHFDADETWSIGALAGAHDVETVALHEIGHLLGLGHSEVEGAIMYPTIASGITKGLHQDDVDGIQALYGA